VSTAAILSYPAHGHIAPALGVAKELAARGERVVFWATGRSCDKIKASGAEFRPYSSDYNLFDPKPPTDGLFSDMVRLASLTEELLPNLLRQVEAEQPDYLLLDTKSLWGRILAHILGLPAVTMSVVFAIQQGLVSTADLVNLLYGRAPFETLLAGVYKLSAYLEVARRLGSTYGVSIPGIIGYLGNPNPLNIIFTSREFQLNGDAFDERFQFVGPFIPPDRDADVQFPWDNLTGAPLIYISLGTTFHDAPEFYATCFDAFAGCPWQVVLSAASCENLGPVPANFIVRSYVPQLKILQQADLLVTHGGMNSVNEGLYFGCPMIVVPQRGDQHLVAARVAELGAGLTIAPSRIDSESLRSAAAKILADTAFQGRAAMLGQSLRDSGGAGRAADEILRYRRNTGVHPAALGRPRPDDVEKGSASRASIALFYKPAILRKVLGPSDGDGETKRKTPGG
jgi:MGT family glycosyltransferase